MKKIKDIWKNKLNSAERGYLIVILMALFFIHQDLLLAQHKATLVLCAQKSIGFLGLLTLARERASTNLECPKNLLDFGAVRNISS